MTIPTLLQEALRSSITSGTFVDTKFWVFSKRSSKPGRVRAPKALFTNGHVVKRVQQLDSSLGERESKEDLRAKFPVDRKPYTDNFDYEDDSDLDDDDEDVIFDDEPVGAPQVTTEEPGNTDDDIITVGNSDAKTREPSDIISVSDLDSLFSGSPDAGSEGGAATSAHIGKVVIIEDVAFVTFQASLRYLYTGEIEFAPWGSAERRKARSLEKISEAYGIPKPSPKSIYRLADKYDIPELKELALRQIRQDISKCSIAEELFSKYTSWYPQLRELELKQLARVLLSSQSGPTQGVLNAKIRSYTNGELPHAKHVLPALYKLMESDESVEETPLPTALASSNRRITGGDWDGLKRALTSSLTSGTFLDSQFYAVESKSSTGPPMVRPVYFCSAVGGDFASKLTAHSSKLGARSVSLPRCADGYDSDVDDERHDQEGTMEYYPCSKCVREYPTPTNLPTEPALLLKSGAAKTWSALFLYVYTGQITFGAIGSRPTPSSGAEESQESGGLSVPSPSAVVAGPCSPKSIYRLAEQVGLIGLCDIAFNDIRSKLDENNILQELFSPFAADHQRVREMEHQLFQCELKPSVDDDLLSKIIQSSSSGENSHRAAAMELIFERSVRERRERMAVRVRDSLRPGPAPEPKRSNERMSNPIQPADPISPAPAPQPVSRSPPKPQSTPRETAQRLKPAPEPEPTQKTVPAGIQSDTGTHQKSAPDTKTSDSEPTITFLRCSAENCSGYGGRDGLKGGLYCGICRDQTAALCANCGFCRSTKVSNCKGCGLKFLRHTQSPMPNWEQVAVKNSRFSE